jgi:uncharacterized iron-regulated protein
MTVYVKRLKRAKDQINKDGLGAIVTWDEANVRHMTAYYITTPNRPLRHSLLSVLGTAILT